MTDKLLYNAEEARELLGVGEKKFRALGIPARKLGKRKMYSLEDLKLFINRLDKEEPCQSIKERGRPTGSTISQSRGSDFAEVRKLLIKQQPSHGRRQNETKPFLVTGGSHA